VDKLGDLIKHSKMKKTADEQAKDSPVVNPQSIARQFYSELTAVIPPKTQSDRTGFTRVMLFLLDGVQTKKFTGDIYERALILAREAAGPKSRNPAAVFMQLMKQELGYGMESTKHHIQT
jgi:hypothetical protein